MADKKTTKTNKNTQKKTNTQENTQANTAAKPGKKRVIYQHHRKFVGGGLVGLIIFAFLVGTEIIPMEAIQPAGNQKAADIRVLDRVKDPSRPHQSVVARNEEGQSDAVIKLHNKGENTAKAGQDASSQQQQQTTLADLRNSLDKLHKITQGQQQMIRMLNQKQEQQNKEMKEQIQNVSLQVTNALESDQPTMFKINDSLTRLQLRQDTLFFQNQWHQGFLRAEDLYQWQAYIQNHGYVQAADIVTDLAKSVEDFGVINRLTLRQTAAAISVGSAPVAPNESTTTVASADDNNPEPTLWQKIKNRFSDLISIRRVDAAQPAAAADPDLRNQLTAALADENMAMFWQLMQTEDVRESEDSYINRLRVLVDVHITQTNAFQQLYSALTAAKKQ